MLDKRDSAKRTGYLQHLAVPIPQPAPARAPVLARPQGSRRIHRDAETNTDQDSIAQKILSEFPDVPMERLANLNREDPEDREIIARVHQLALDNREEIERISTTTEGTDTVDERTPSQRRRDLEFQY